MQQTEDYRFIAEQEDEGTRLDVQLSKQLEGVSRNRLQQLIEGGHIKINGSVVLSKKHGLKEGDCLEIQMPEPEILKADPEHIPLNIVYEDADLLVVNKPKGMVVHPANGNQTGTLVNALLYHCDNLSGINGVIRPGIVHRIDKDTSGLLMVAKNDRAHNGLAEQLASHSITRAYRAVVYHNFLQDGGTVDAPIGRDPKDRLKMAVTELHSKRAVTHYQILERFGDFTYIEARLETGRTHQIRVHMAHIHHPLMGDQVYGPKKTIMGANTQMLHAMILGFVHPATGEYMEFKSEPPEEFQKILDKLRVRSGAL